MDLHGVGAVLQLVVSGKGVGGEFARLSHGNDPLAQFAGQGRAEQKSSRFDGHYGVDISVFIAFHQLSDGEIEGFHVAEERRYVFEDDSRLREIGHISDVFFQVHMLCAAGHGLGTWAL